MPQLLHNIRNYQFVIKMNLRYLLHLTLLWNIAACNGPSPSSSSTATTHSGDSVYHWTKILDSGAWKKSYNFQMFNVRDTLWVFHPDGNWFSADGKNWTKSVLPNAINNLAFLDYIYFKDAIYGLGHFEGNIERFTQDNTVYRSSDMRTWEETAGKSNLPGRFFYHPFVFRDKIWIIGGEDKSTRYADIWNSEDAINWTRKKDSMPFGKRINSQVVQKNDTLFLLNNDVWISLNGLDWQLLIPEIVKGQEVFGYEAQVFDNKIWLIGCNRNGQFLSQVMYSVNGKEWKDLPAPWTPRGGMATTICHNKIWMTGGKYGGTPNQPEFVYSNDLWTLEVK